MALGRMKEDFTERRPKEWNAGILKALPGLLTQTLGARLQPRPRSLPTVGWGIAQHRRLTRGPSPTLPHRGWREQDMNPRVTPSPIGGGLGWGHRTTPFFESVCPAPATVQDWPASEW